MQDIAVWHGNLSHFEEVQVFRSDPESEEEVMAEEVSLVILEVLVVSALEVMVIVQR